MHQYNNHVTIIACFSKNVNYFSQMLPLASCFFHVYYTDNSIVLKYAVYMLIVFLRIFDIMELSFDD